MEPDSNPQAAPPVCRAALGRLGLTVLVLLHLVPFAVRPALIGGDEPHYALMAHSLGVERDVELDDEYQAVADGAVMAGRKLAGSDLDRHQRSTPRGAVFAHPIGVSLLAAPVVALTALVAPGAPPDIVLGLLVLVCTGLGLFAGLDLLGQTWGRPGVTAGLALYLCTPLWFYSRTFFTEPFLWSFAVVSLWLLRRRRVALALAVASVLPWLKEPGVLLLAGLLIATVGLYGWRASLRGLPVVALSGLLLLGKNHLLYGSPWATPQPFQYGDVLRGMAGLLVDGRHGVLWFAPLAVLSAIAWPFLPRAWSFGSRVAAGAGAAFFVLTASWIDWTGGSCFGPRLLLPILPIMAWPLAALWTRWQGTRALGWLVGAAALGFGIQLAAVIDPFTAFWGVSIGELVSSRLPVVLVGGLVTGALLVGSGRRIDNQAAP